MSAPPASKGLILIADDNAAFRMATRAYLRQHGYECEVAPDGSVAADLLRARAFDLLISDINMPGNRGLEFIENLPQVAAGLPVILLTGFPSPQSAARSERLQVIAYLVKPPEPEELLALVDKTVAAYRARRSPA